MKIYENYIENTANKAVINQTVDVVHDVSDCYAVKCNVTASNALDESAPSVTVVSFPRGRFTERTHCRYIEPPTGDIERHSVASV